MSPHPSYTENYPETYGAPNRCTHRSRTLGETISHERYPWEPSTEPDDLRGMYIPQAGETIRITEWAGCDLLHAGGVTWRVTAAEKGDSPPWLWLSGTRVHPHTGEPIPFTTQRPGPDPEWIFVRATEILTMT